MTPRRRTSDREPWFLKYWQLLAAVIAGAIWLGALQQRVANLERATTFYHGSLELPSPKGQ